MDGSKKSILVFDSGFGGLSVLKRLVRLMPKENWLYLGDSANAPYGVHTTEEIIDYTLSAIGSVFSENVKAIVIACNTATAAAEDALKAAYPGVPVIGIEPAAKAAAAENDRTLCLATASTLNSARFASQMKEIRKGAELYPVPAPKIVTYVEAGATEKDELREYLKELFSPYTSEKIDAVVLGCTHFPFAADVIEQAIGYSVKFYDAGSAVAEEVKSTLSQCGQLCDEGPGGSITMLNSTCDDEYLRNAWKIFGFDIPD